MMNLLFNVSKMGELVLNTCGSYIATAKELLQMPEPLRVLGCENDFVYFQDALQSPIEVYASLTLSADSDMAEKDKAI